MQGAEALHEATLIIGAKRLLENLPDFCTQNRIAMYKIGEILSVLETTKEQNIALVYSGDTGFIPAPLHCAACSMNATSNTP